MLKIRLTNNIGVKLKNIFYTLYLVECIIGLIAGVVVFIGGLAAGEPLYAFLSLIAGLILPLVLLPGYYICYGFAQIVHRAEVGNSVGSFVIDNIEPQCECRDSKSKNTESKSWSEYMSAIGEYLNENSSDEISVKEVKAAARACGYTKALTDKDIEAIQNYLDQHS